MNDKQPRKMSKGLIWAIVIAGVLIIGSIGNAMNSGGTAPKASTSSSASNSDFEAQRTLPTSIDSKVVANPSDLQVAFFVKNDSSSTLTPTCSIEATDSSGTYHGIYMAEQDPIAAGVNERLIAPVKIDNSGAQYVTDVKVKCTAWTSDTSSSAGKAITVTEVSECGGNDGSTWYWAACFKVDAPVKTLMTCTANALDSAGKQVATMTYQANTLNDGTATGYGDGAGTQDTTATIYKSIKKLEVTCHL